ncbi:MAG: vWA domain-containing protein [Gammaproteobacteria bacterium]
MAIVRSRRNISIFSMALLDVVCCGFGAMVLLVLLSKNDVEGGTVAQDMESQLLELIAARKQVEQLQQSQLELQQQVNQLQSDVARAQEALPDPEALEQKQLHLVDALSRLEDLQARKQQRLEQERLAQVVNVGGIPAESDYVVFVLDTSGSMQAIWQRVLQEIEHILDIHPQVKGFQVLSDNGAYLLPKYAKRWIPDSPRHRRSMFQQAQNWTSFSNSSPAEGLAKALQVYAKNNRRLSIYVFGDDYTGASFEQVLEQVARQNRAFGTLKKPIARIHGVGFLTSLQSASSFATLMREIARQNDGAFIGIGTQEP